VSVFSTIDHVGIAVQDLDEALAWYRDNFEMEPVHIEVNEDQGVREAMLRVAAGDDGPLIQLLAPLRPDSPIARFLDRSGPGIQQLAYRVDDVVAAAATLRGRGMRDELRVCGASPHRRGPMFALRTRILTVALTRGLKAAA
jgi:methylmalonyl-CoA/ethylmalonyl-CoA epimerase